MVPPWVPDAPLPELPDAAEPPSSESPGDADPQSPNLNGQDSYSPIPIAPSGRFSGVRRSLGDFARSGDRAEMRRGLGRYVRSGYGGSATAARRMGGTASTAGALYGALKDLSSGQAAPAGSALDPAILSGRSAQEVIDAVVEAVRPVDGTQDSEVSRLSIREALTELLTRFPEADLTDLTEDQRRLVIERFTAQDVFRRIDLDVGKSIRDKAPSASAALLRLKQVRDYVKEVVAAAFRRFRETQQAITAARVSAVVRDTLSEAFQVFEGYAE